MTGTPRQPRKIPIPPERNAEHWERCPSRIKRGHLDRLRDAVAALQARGINTILEGHVSTALLKEAKRLELKHNRGERFAVRDEALPAGRRGKPKRDENGKLIAKRERTRPRTHAEKLADEPRAIARVEAVELLRQSREERRRARQAAEIALPELDAALAAIDSEESDGTEDSYPLGEETAILRVPTPKPPTDFEHAISLLELMSRAGACVPRPELVMDLA